MWSRFRRYIGESIGELKKLHYPKREEVINATVAVISFTIMMAILLGSVDILSQASVSWLVRTADWFQGGDVPEFTLLQGVFN